MSRLVITNRQRTRPVNRRLFRRVAGGLFGELPGVSVNELAVHFLGDEEMARLNETFLRHDGPTDVITFDHSPAQEPDPGRVARVPRSMNEGGALFQATGGELRRPKADRKSAFRPLHGEIFICVDEAVRNARRFRTSWQAEVIRYLVHGCLHLLGHDDKSAPARRAMKLEENRLLKRLASRFPLSRLHRRRTVRA